MSNPALSRDRYGRRYVWPPGTATPELDVPSVTNILGKLNKPALPNWAAKAVAEFAHDNLASWQDLPRDAAIDLLKRAPWRDRDRAAAIGSAVHHAIEAHTTGETAMVDPDLLPYISGALQFLESHVDQLVHIEATIFSRKYAYAGTCDLVATLKDGRMAVIDWKTSRSGLWPEVALQLVAYAKGDFVGYPDGRSVPLPDIDVGMAVHLKDDATYTAREVEISDRAWRTFVALRSIQKWKDDHEADALGAEYRGGGDAA